MNFYEHKEVKKIMGTKKKNPSFENTNINLNSRILIIGASGTGKTNTLVNFVAKSPNTFGLIIIVNKGIEEPLYDYLKSKLKGSIMFHTLETLPSLEEYKELIYDQDLEVLIVFDDLVNDLKKDTKIKNYFIAGRKLNLTMVFISQDYHKVDKVIRGQLNYLLLHRVSSTKDIKLILSDYALGVDKNNLIAMYEDATKQPLNYLKIDIQQGDINKKFSKNLKDFYN